MTRRLIILTWLATAISLAGFVLCVALPWFSVSIQTSEQHVEADIFVWTEGTFRVPWNAWVALVLFLGGAFLSRILANQRKLNGILLAGIGAVILLTTAIVFLPSRGGITIPGIRGERAVAPFAVTGAAILLIFVAIELFRQPNTNGNRREKRTDS